MSSKHHFKAEILLAVVDLVKEAGSGVLAIYDRYKKTPDSDIGLTQKKDHSPLTDADLACHTCLDDGLRQLTPQTPIVSEECEASLAHRSAVGMFWLIDPLDGTKEFLARNDEFTVNVALVCDGKPVWGVVYAPALGQLYWGGRDFGAYREEAGIIVGIRVADPVPKGSTRRVVASKSHLNAETENLINHLGAVTLIQAGSSLKLCRVAEGAADVYPRLAPTCEWDTAAAQAVVEGAGGFVVNVQGVPLMYGKSEVLNPSFIVSSMPLGVLLASD